MTRPLVDIGQGTSRRTIEPGSIACRRTRIDWKAWLRLAWIVTGSMACGAMGLYVWINS